MRLKYFFIFIFIFSCSFDDKSGIWNNENISSLKEEKIFSEFETLSSKDEVYKKIIPIENNFKFKKIGLVSNKNWTDIYYKKTNNLENFNYLDKNEIIIKSKRISKYKIKDGILFENGNYIVSNLNGDIITLSKVNKTLKKFNFYKKRYKKTEKRLNLIIENNIIYVSDNIGYLYAYDYKEEKILWAKNYKVPFRSNLKIYKNQLIAANQNNSLYFFNKFNGDIIKLIPTEETILNNEFINNLALDNSQIYFLNTYGSLYAININNKKINWFLNLNQSIDLNKANLFSATEVIIYNNKTIISSDKYTYIIDSNTGSIIFKKNFSNQIRPVVIENYLIIVTKNNLLITIDLNSNKIIYSYDIDAKIAEHLNIKKEKIQIKSLFIANDKIFLFLKNSYFLKFNLRGNLLSVNKLIYKINTSPIFLDNSMIYIDSKNKLLTLN